MRPGSHGLGLRARMLIASLGLALVVGAAFGVLLGAIRTLHREEQRSRHSEQVLAAANGLEKLVLDIETGMRGYIITRRPAFLQPWRDATRELPGHARQLEQLVADNPSQEARAKGITKGARAYIDTWANPLVRAAAHDNLGSRELVLTGEGKRQVDALRVRFAAFSAAENVLASQRQRRTTVQEQRAIMLGLGGLAGSVLLILLFAAYLSRAIVMPVRRVATAARRLARGELDARVPEAGAGEIGVLGRAFNEMGHSLEESRDELEVQNAELETQAVELEEIATTLAGEKDRIESFYGFGEKLATELDPNALSQTILRELSDIAGAELGTIYTLDDGSDDRYRLSATRSIRAAVLADELEPGDGLAGRALSEGRAVHASFGETTLPVSGLGAETTARHELHLPLVHSGRPLGVVTLARVDARPFDEVEIEALEHLATQAAVAFDNALLFRSAMRQASINSAVLEAGVDGIGMLDLDGRVVLANAAFEHTVSELIGEPANLLADRRMMQELGALIAARVVNPDAYRAGLPTLREDPEREAVHEYELAGNRRTFQRYSAPVRDDEGVVIGQIITLREVTREREAERLKSELVATVSHELRTPLTGILGFAELLVSQDVGDDTRDRYLTTIHSEARRLTVMINEFLDLQRIEDGSFTLALEPFDIASLLVEEVDILRPQHPSHTLELESPLANLIVAGDRERIRQVIRNLVSNAIKYSPAGGRVIVAAANSGVRARVSVRDEGLGIPKAQQGEIFTKFFRVDSSDTREIGGTGLGLALCREITEAHGGRIGFESDEGVGSTFWFELPTGARAPRDGRPRVLVIEDEPAAALLLTTYAAEAGCAIDTATTGEAGLSLALECPPALICLDVGLAGELDGWQVLARLKEHPSTANVPVVICTAGNGRKRAAFLGAADFITKPFSRDRLLEALHRLLPKGRGKALVVEDDETIRHLIGDTLTAQGFVVYEVDNGEDALAAIAADQPDVVLLDLMMPRLDGFAVLERLRGEPATQFMPVIVITARRLSAKERASLQAQTVAVLEKSEYSSDELHRLLDVALAK